MGFIRTLLTTVGSTALLLLGTAAKAQNEPTGDNGRLKITITPRLNLTTLYRDLIEATGGNLSVGEVEDAIHSLFENMSRERVLELPTFARELSSLQLEPMTEVVAVETMLAKVTQLPRTVIGRKAAIEVAGRIFDEFVTGRVLIGRGGGGFNPRRQFLFAPVEEVEFDAGGVYTG